VFCLQFTFNNKFLDGRWNWNPRHVI
jgi:hypothetical protein